MTEELLSGYRIQANGKVSGVRLRARWDRRRFPAPPPEGSDLYSYCVRCPKCSGRGFPLHTSQEKCKNCFGFGLVPFVDMPADERPNLYPQLALPLEVAG